MRSPGFDADALKRALPSRRGRLLVDPDRSEEEDRLRSGFTAVLNGASAA
jgi:hypothetical protein